MMKQVHVESNYISYFKLQPNITEISSSLALFQFFIAGEMMCITVQSRNRYHIRMALRKVRIPTWLGKVGILTLHRAIPEWSLRKVGIWTK